MIHIQFFRSNQTENAAPDTSRAVTVKFQLQWGTVNRGDFESYTSASILDKLEGLTTGGVGQITIPAGASFAELVLKPDAELVIEPDSGTFTVTLLPDSEYEIATQKRAIYGTKRLYEYDSLTYTVYDGAVLYIQGNGDPTAVYYNDVDQGRVLDCYLMAAMAAATKIDPSIITNAITDNGNYTYTVRLFRGNGTLYTAHLTLAEVLDRGECMAQPADVSPTGAVEIWPVVLEHAIDKMMGEGGYAGGFAGNSSSIFHALTNCNENDERSTQYSMPVKPDTQSAENYFNAFVDNVLVPNQSAGKQVILNSKQKKRNENGEIIDGTINGDGDKTVTAAHAYVVLSWDTTAGTITFYDPRGWITTIDSDYLRDFQNYDIVSQ